MPDSIRSPELWNALMGEWGRRPGRPSPMRRPAALLFRRGGHYVERDSVQRERAGRFEVSSNVDAEPGGWLTRRPEGASRRIDRVRFAGPDTLILCGATAGGACDTFVATRRGPAR
jgi:hypothetical protein